MRVRMLLSLMVVLVLFGATSATAQNAGVVKFDDYGLSVALPVPFEPMSLQVPPLNGLIRAYRSKDFVYVVVVTDDIQPKTGTARQALGMMVSAMTQIASKVPSMGLHVISGSTAQGVSASGFGGRVSEAPQGKNAGKSAMDFTNQIPAELKQLFGNDIYQALLMAPFTEQGRMVAGVAVIGPGKQSMEIDAQAMQLMATVSIGSKSVAAQSAGVEADAAPTGPDPVTVKPINELKRGQIELIGKVSALDKSGKSLSMMVSQVASYGQPAAVLDPARLKKIFVKSVPADVKCGSTIVVVAIDSGVGKPVKALTLESVPDTK